MTWYTGAVGAAGSIAGGMVVGASEGSPGDGFQLRSLSCYVRGTGPVPPVTLSAEAYVRGYDADMPLKFASGVLGSSNAQLGNFMLASDGNASPVSIGMPLFVRGTVPGTNLIGPDDLPFPLFSHGRDTYSQAKMLFAGETPSLHMPLFVQNNDTPFTGAIELFARGGTPGVGEFTGAMSLYAFSGEDGNLARLAMKLFVDATAPPQTFTMPLFVSGGGVPVGASLPLFLQNSAGYESGKMLLFTEGEGFLDGAQVATGKFKLFIRRNPSAMLELFLKGEPEPTSAALPLFMNAAGVSQGGIPLVVPNAVGLSTKAKSLFARGF